ncbi:beta-galactosidase [Microbacterium insulae]|uniref:Beta-galactosidase n=1 Tax=Microbacterium insulae TaxID=483014 RepID=A0ABW3AFT6_9MICO
MTATSRVSAPALSITHQQWESPLSRPVMSNEVDRHARIRLTNQFVERDGVPFIPVSGEMHFSRVPREAWAERLQLMKSGGITTVASYVFWIHHEERHGELRFDGNRDVRAFVELCEELGLDVVLRIGPWCHGEARNGGFPDWVQHAPVAHRTDDPAYLGFVRPWFAALAEQLTGLFGPHSPIIAIQIENELYDQPQHIVTLKRIAREVGMSAPIWTATGWGGAELPDGEVMPLFGGYADGFWVNWDAPWDITFREHFFFSHVWDDPGIGADLRAHAGIGGGAVGHPSPRTPSTLFPAATCELGGGMAKAYHRRPCPTGLDIATVAHNKIGNGSAWQGYYMYTGGTNPAVDGGAQESHATGYPNDLARFDYDFEAPIGATGRLNDTHSALRRQHAFLRAFGEVLAPMPSSLPTEMPRGVEDVDTLRWALRSNGSAGFVFVSWHQPFVSLEPYPDAQFHLVLNDTVVQFPDRPVTIPAGTLAHWPVNLTVGGVTLDWATASPLTVLDGDTPTLVLTAETGIDARIALAEGVAVADSRGAALTGGVVTVDPVAPAVLRATSPAGELDILVIPSTLANDLWVLEGPGGRQLVLSSEPLWLEGDRLTGRHTDALPSVHRYSPSARHFVAVEVTVTSAATPYTPLQYTSTVAALPVPTSYGSFDERASAPVDADFQAYADRLALGLPPWARDGELTVAWAGDVARLVVDGVPVGDQFWSGGNWVVDLRPLDLGAGAAVELEVLPMHPAAQVNLSVTAAHRRTAAAGPLGGVEEVGAAVRGRWQEASL